MGRPKTAALSAEPTVSELDVYRELCRGRTRYDVAKEFSISWSTVELIRQRVNDYFFRENIESIKRLKAEHTERLTHVVAEAMTAWEASKNPAVRTCDSDKAGNSTTKTTTSGNSSFLAEARAALGEIRKIWGADAPLKIETTDVPRAAGKPAEEYRQELVKHVQGLMKQVLN